jgi:hypothetical protein
MTTQTVHVRINDAATGQPTPCRVRFTVGSRYFAPFGRLAEFNPESTVDIGGNVGLAWEWAYIDGTCEIGLPPGEIRIEISKGPEYRPIDTRIQLTPGKLSLRLSIERWADLRAEGWHSGDTRCYHLSPQAALLEGAGEDLAVINLLAHEREGRDGEGRAIPNILDFSGQRPAAELPGHMVVVNTANEHDTLGRLLLLNCHRVVYPLRFGWPLSRENWTLRDWCDQCHRKGGLVIADNLFESTIERNGLELLPNVVSGRIDALEFGNIPISSPCVPKYTPPSLRDWYRLLDSGVRIPLAAGSAKARAADFLGRPRTYARLNPGEPLYKGWVEAVRAGRTFVTYGTLMDLRVNGQGPGSVVHLTGPSAVVRVRAAARSLGSFVRLELVANDRVIASAAPHGDPLAAVVEADVPM